MNEMATIITSERKVPKSFALIPTGDDRASFQIIISSTHYGTIWTENEQWMACTCDGAPLEVTHDAGIQDAIHVVFESRHDDVMHTLHC